jgi:RNA polymerase primary sigma factor
VRDSSRTTERPRTALADRERLVESHLPRIASLARRFLSRDVDLADLMQEGFLALLEAQGRYEPDRGVPFWAYAAPWVHGAISCFAHEQRRAVRLPAAAQVELRLLRDASQQLARVNGRNPSLSTVAREVGVPAERAGRILAAGLSPRSLQEPFGPDGDGAAAIDAVPDPSAEGPFDRVVERAGDCASGPLMRVLSPREREVIARRFGLAGPEETLAVIGRRLGVTRERVRQIEARALDKLRQAADGLSPVARRGEPPGVPPAVVPAAPRPPGPPPRRRE